MGLTQQKMIIWHLICNGAIISFMKLGDKSINSIFASLAFLEDIRKTYMQYKSYVYVQILVVSSENQN